MDTPKISVIIPTYNRPGFLAQAVHSVLAQTLPVHEIIIVDDGSSPPLAPAISQVASLDRRIQLFRFEVNKGVSAARNFGLQKSTGDFIIFLDDDDLLYPKMFKTSQKQFLITPNADVVYGWNCIFLNQDDPYHIPKQSNISLPTPEEILYIDKHEAFPPIKDQPFSAFMQICIQISSSMFKRKSLNGFLFPEELSWAEDAYFWLSFAATGHKFLGINECSTYHRIHPFRSLSRPTSKDDINTYYQKLSDSGMVDDRIDILLIHFMFFLRFWKIDRTKSIYHAVRFLWHFLRPATIANYSLTMSNILIYNFRRRRDCKNLRKVLAEMRARNC